MSKSKGDRNKASTPSQNVQTAAPSNPIVPGKFMENDWHQLVEEDDSADFVCELLDEVVGNASDVIFDKIIKDNVRPYAVATCRKQILDFIAWQFLKADQGEVDIEEDVSWLEDEEPKSSTTDSWSQGSVPILCNDKGILTESNHEDNNESSRDSHVIAASPIPLEETALDETVLQDSPTSDISSSPSSSGKGSSIEEDHTKFADDNVDVELLNDVTTISKSEMPFESDDQKILPSAQNMTISKPPGKTKSMKFRPRVGRLPSFHSPSLTPIMDDRAYMDHILSMEKTYCSKREKGPYINFEPFDTRGKRLKEEDFQIRKMSFNKLPTHRVKTGFSVIDSNAEKLHNQNNIRKKKNTTPLSSQMSTSNEILTDITKSFVSVSNSSSKVYMEKDPRRDLPPLLLDSINASPGVVVHEAGIIKSGPKRKTKRTELGPELKPIGASSSNSGILTANDIIRETAPIIKPMGSGSKPLPFISSSVK